MGSGVRRDESVIRAGLSGTSLAISSRAGPLQAAQLQKADAHKN
jgi:hypothetical protein